MPTRLGLILLDLDGTLIESLPVKDNAFAALYAESGRLTEIMAYHRSYNHVVRFDKFRHISEEILGVPLSAGEADRLAREFQDLVYAGLVACPEVPGARDLLDHFRGGPPMVLISRSPDGELRRLLAARGLAPYFDEVYSADWTKAAAIEDALRRWPDRLGDAVYIGDAPEDARAAASHGVAFVGRESGRGLTADAGPIFPDMFGVLAHLKETVADAD